MRFYKSGIYTPTATECAEQTVSGFYINLDGYSMDMEYNGYYILKYPFGKLWGENGNMRFIKKKSNNYGTKGLCRFYQYAYQIEAANT